MSNPEPGEPKKNRFTFVHFLVLLIVVNSLIALLGSPFGAAREKARRVSCLSNLKQIGLAMRLYSGDHSQRFPSDAAETTIGSFALMTNNYMTAYKSWVCPSDRRRSAGSQWESFTSNNVSYAYNGFGLTEAVQPDTPLACDASVGDIRRTKPWTSRKDNHKKDGGCVLYADGHVEFRKELNPPMYRGKNP